MELSAFLDQLRDPIGLPFYGVVFQALMVLTFALHILIVNLVTGSLFIAIWSRFGGSDHQRRLANTLTKVATIGISVAVVLGVAPLLFVQVIYDPFWYTANLLSAWWSMLFLLLITLGFVAAYIFYLWREKRPVTSLSAGIFSFATILAAGTVIHMLSMEALAPQFWSTWFSGNDQLATSGWSFRAFHIGRLGHFLIPAFINVGIFMMLFGWYFDKKPGSDAEYIKWVADTGGILVRGGLVAQAVFGLWWLFTLPDSLGFLRNPGFHLGVTLAVVGIGALFWTANKPLARAPLAALISLLAILAMSISREALRMAYVGAFDYSIYDYPVQVDWGSTLLFLGTFVAGLIVLSYPLLVAFKAGRGEDV